MKKLTPSDYVELGEKLEIELEDERKWREKEPEEMTEEDWNQLKLEDMARDLRDDIYEEMHS